MGRVMSIVASQTPTRWLSQKRLPDQPMLLANDDSGALRQRTGHETKHFHGSCNDQTPSSIRV